jgi:hypothetical protein
MQNKKNSGMADDFGNHLVFGPFDNWTSSIIMFGFQVMI